MVLASTLVLVGSVACGGGDGPDEGGAPSKPRRAVGRIQAVLERAVTVDGTAVTDAADLVEGSVVVSDDSGEFDFSLNEKVRRCRADPGTRLQVHPRTGELVHWIVGSSTCTTTKGPQDYRAGQSVLLKTVDPVFRVVVGPRQVSVKVRQGAMEVSSGGETVNVRSNEEVTVLDGQPPPAPRPINLTPKERLVVEQVTAQAVLEDAEGSSTTTEETSSTSATTATSTSTTEPPTTTTARVPDVVGLDAPAAEAKIEAAGFAVKRVRVNSFRLADRVMGTNPQPGASAQKGSTVELQLAKGDCIPYDATKLSISDAGAEGWRLVQGTMWMALLDTKADAEQALAVARRHTAQCFIGRGNSRPDRKRYIVQYWMGSSGQVTKVSPEDCIGHDPARLEIVDLGAQGWRLQEGSHWMLLLDNQSDAEDALMLAKRYNAHCFIGRDNTRPNRSDYIFEYWESK